MTAIYYFHVNTLAIGEDGTIEYLEELGIGMLQDLKGIKVLLKNVYPLNICLIYKK